MSLAKPIKTWVATFNSGQFVSVGSGSGRFNTVTIHITDDWEIQVPFGVRYGSNVSLATAVFIYAMNAGGAQQDTEPIVAFSIASVASVNKIVSVRLTTGQYLAVMQVSSPSVSCFVFTGEKVSAYTFA